MNKVEINSDSILIYVNGEILVSWSIDEWTEDETVTVSIANAIQLFYTDIDKLINLLKPFYQK